MTVLLAKVIWVCGVITWYVVRYRFARRSRKIAIIRRDYEVREHILLAISAIGLGVLPGLYVLIPIVSAAADLMQAWLPWTGSVISAAGLIVPPELGMVTSIVTAADYPMQAWQPWVGGLVFGLSLYMFRQTHRALGRNWSLTLEVREQHALITEGIYKFVRHPMYTAFWLWALAQALLIPNAIVGPAGLVGFGTLYFFRVRKEESLMLETFGDEYRAYIQRTGRLIPRVY